MLICIIILSFTGNNTIPMFDTDSIKVSKKYHSI